MLTHVARNDAAGHKVDGVRPLLVRAATTADGGSILLTYDEELSATTAGVGAFTVTVAGTARAVDSVAANGDTVTLSLTVALTRDEQAQAVTLDYTDPTAGADDAAAVQDAAGNDAAGFQNRQVLTRPTVSLLLTPPSIAEDDGVSTVTATLSRGWTEAFTVTVTATPVAPAAASDFTLSGSALSFAANATASSGTVTITAHNDDVDSRDKIVTVAATVSTTEVRAPDEVTLTIEDDEPADATLSALRLRGEFKAVTLDPEFAPGEMAYTASVGYATSTVVVFATPTAADATVAFLDGDGAALPDDEPAADGHAVSLALGESTIRAQVSAHDGTAATYTVTVTRKAPELQSVRLVSDPDVTGRDDDTYQIGDTIAAAAVFDVAVTVSGTPELELDVGGEARTAAYAGGSGSKRLTFAYTVAEGDVDTDGVAIGADKLAAGGATIAADGHPAMLTHKPVSSRRHKVDGVRPLLVRAAATADGGSIVLTYDEELSSMTAGVGAFTVTVAGAARAVDRVAANGDTVTLTLTVALTRDEQAQQVTLDYGDPTAGADDAAAVQDAAGNDAAGFQGREVLTRPAVSLLLTPPSIAEDDGESTVTATVTRGWTEAFTVTVTATPVAPATASDFTLSGSALEFAADATASSGTLTITARGNDVDAPDKTVTVAATVSTMEVRAPDEVTLTILDDEPADATLQELSVTGVTLTPAFSPDETEYTASVGYATAIVTVIATPAAGDAEVALQDGDGAALPDADASAAGRQVSLAVDENTISVQVTAHDGTTETYTVTLTRLAPALQSVELVSDPDASGADDDTYQIGDTIAAAAVFDVAVTVSGTPELELDVGGEARTAAYASGSGSKRLTFAYTVAEGDADADGVAIGADKLTAAGGASIAADGTPAVLTHEATSDAAGHKVDGVRPLLVRAATTADGGSIVLTYDEELSSMTAGVGAFTVTVAGTARAVDSVAANGDTVTLTLTVALTRDEQEQAVTLDYTDPTAGADDAAAVQDAAGNDAAGFQNRQVLTLPVVVLALEPVSIAEDGGVSRVTATVTRGWTEAFTVTVTATPVAPATASDFTLSGSALEFAADATASSGTLTITARGNDVDAPDKTVTVAATVSTMEVRAPDEVTLTILDDEPADATLQELSVTGVTLTPAFSPDETEYTASVGYATAIVTVIATPAAGDAEVAFLDGDGAALPDADASEPGHQVRLTPGANPIRAQVSAHDGTTETYTVTLTRKAPELQSVGLVSDPDASGADDDTYQIGDTMAAAAVFDVAVTVSGTPELELDVGGEARTAAYASGSGSKRLTFAYTVAEGDADADGVAIGADKLTAAGGASIAADGTPAVLTHEATSDAAGHKVDGVRPLLVRAATTADGGSIVLTYDEELSSMTAGVGAFTVTVAGTARAVDSVAANGDTVTLTLTVALTRDEQEQAVTLDYTDPTAGADDAAAVQDAAGNDAAGFQGRQVLTLPVVVLALEPVSIAEDGGVSRVTATVSRGWTEAFTVTVTATPVAPATASDFTLSGSALEFAADATASSGTLTITARGNDVDAPDKTVTVAATVSTMEVRAPDEVTLTILDDEPADATLQELSVTGVTLTPAFSPDETEYTASVGYATAIVTVIATPAAGDAEVAFLDGDGAALPDADASEPATR